MMRIIAVVLKKWMDGCVKDVTLHILKKRKQGTAVVEHRRNYSSMKVSMLHMEKGMIEYAMYECKTCLKRYEHSFDAVTCCIPEEVHCEIAFKCPGCECLHYEEEDARECCEVETVNGYACEKCNSIYEDEIGAQRCSCRIRAIHTCPKCGKEFPTFPAMQECTHGEGQ
jgi:hypothetical protein